MRRLLLNTALVLVSLLVAAAVAEVTLRWVEPELTPTAELYEMDPATGKRMRAHYRGREFGVEIAINSLGLRMRETSVAKPDDTIRVLAVGDSWTFGFRLPEPMSYPRQLERILRSRARPGARTIEVVNAGVVGYSTRQEAAYLTSRGGDLDPDLVVVAYYPVNDTHDKLSRYERLQRVAALSPWGFKVYRFPSELRLRPFIKGSRRLIQRHFAQFRVGLAERLGYHDATAAAVVDDDWTPAYREDGHDWKRTRQAILDIGDWSRGHSVPTLVVLLPDVGRLARYLDRDHPRIEPLVREAVGAAGLDWLDLADAFGSYRDSVDEVRLPGYRHPNAAGYREIAQAVADRIEQAYGGLLRPPAAPSAAPAPKTTELPSRAGAG